MNTRELYERMINRFTPREMCDLYKMMQIELANARIERVVFNNPATVILWDDGTKTVVKCQPGDTYDKEKGFALAYLKKLLGNDNTFNKEIRKWCPSVEEKPPVKDMNPHTNFDVICVKYTSDERNFTIGKKYPVRNCVITDDTGYEYEAWSTYDDSFKSLFDWFSEFQIFELA